MVERLAAAGSFVPNDVRLDPAAEQILIVTGPNMAGKSTLMRQVALTVILAQMGWFVPARTARIGLCDRVFTRVGAGDNLARGESTFMVEMRETAHILRHATAQSLVVLDEIGRGTSTYDGVSIAWAVAEHLHDHVGAKTLFATHYHELARWPPIGRACATSASPRASGRARWCSCASWCPAAPAARSASRSPSWPACRRGGGPRRAPSCARSKRSRRRAAAPDLLSWGCAGRPRRPRRRPGRTACRRRSPLAEIADALRAVDPDDLSPRAAHQLLVELKRKLTPSP